MRLAILISHPIQYYSPWFRVLAQMKNLRVRVFYLWDAGVVETEDKIFGTSFVWDIPLLDGYESMEARLHQQAQEFDVEAAGMQPNVFNIERAEFQMPQQNTDARSSTTHQHGKGDNFAGDQVQGDKSTEP